MHFSVFINGVVRLNVSPCKGGLVPKGHSACRLICYSYGIPCNITFSIRCTLVNITDKLQYIQNFNEYKNIQSEQKEYFTITEDNIQYQVSVYYLIHIIEIF